MGRYSKYQNTDNWFGTIPATWETHRIKRLFALRDKRNFLPLEQVNLISLYSNVGVRQHCDIEHTTGNRARNADGYKVVHKDDIIVNILLCWMGAIGRSNYDGVTSPAYDVYMPRTNINSQYYHYLFRTKAFSGECYKVGKGIMAMRWRTYSPQFMNINVPEPPRAEQDQIVRFLDWKVSEINKKRLLKKKSLELMRELISSTFEKLIHESHENVRLKRIVSLDNAFIDIVEDNYYQKAGMYNRARGIFLRNPIKGSDMGDSMFQRIYRNRLMISGQFAWEDAVYVTDKKDEDGLASHRYYLLKSQNIDAPVEYLFGYFISQKGLSDLQLCSHGSAGRNRPLNINELLRIEIPIVHNTVTIEKFCRLVQAYMKMRPIVLREAALLDELQNQLISDVVTGKIDVRNIPVPAYEHVDDLTADDGEGNDGETGIPGEED
ncbi:hypothetical protein [Megasphaera sp.]|uniref:restriction endonuclease subunit S n=1 Tax=Megasphaera sp. TaxID=2023260 RepID=UPI003078FDDF